MARAIATPIKKAIVRLLQSHGYVLLRQTQYAKIVAQANAAAKVLPSTPIMQPVQPPQDTLLPPEFHLDSSQDREVERFLTRARTVISGSLPDHAGAIFVTAHYLVQNRVPGDVIDCGDGATPNLALIATALVMLGDANRRLVMFDVSGDASHRPDLELPLWGMDTADLIDGNAAQLARGTKTARTLPSEFVATGYPPENISVVRYPIDGLDLSRPVAYLGLVTDTYDSNRAAIRALVPRVSSCGVVAVEGSTELRASQPGCVQYQVDAVDQYLDESEIELAFSRVTARFRVAIKGPPERRTS